MPSSKSRTTKNRSSGAKAAKGRPGGRPTVAQVRTATARDWIGGARIRTLPLAVAPVAVGTAAALVVSGGEWHWVRALLALAVAVAIQIAVNYANDYSDGVRGTDAHRVGPARLTGSGAAKPRTVLIVALVFFGIATVAGIDLIILSGQWWLLAVGAVAIAAAWFYTGGKRPYGYLGLGEVMVFLFFGIVATAGTTYTQVGTVPVESWVGGAAVGLIASAALMVNNLRDREQDARAGKRTLSVMIGDRASRIVFVLMLGVPFGVLAFFALFYENVNFVYFALITAAPAALITLTAKTPKELILALQLTSLTGLLFGLGLAAAIAF